MIRTLARSVGATAATVGLVVVVGLVVSRLYPGNAPKPFGWGGWILFLFLLLNMVGIWAVLFTVRWFLHDARELFKAVYALLNLSREDRDVIAQIREIVKGTVADVRHEAAKLGEAAAVVKEAVAQPGSGVVKQPQE